MDLKNITWIPFNPFKSNNKSTTQMKKFDKFSKILGREITSENIGAVTAEEWEKVNSHSDEPDTNKDTPPNPDTKSEDKPDASAPLTAEVVQGIVTSALKPIDERLQKLEKGPAAGTTPTPVVTGDEKVAKHSWEDPNDPIAQLAAKELEV